MNHPTDSTGSLVEKHVVIGWAEDFKIRSRESHAKRLETDVTNKVKWAQFWNSLWFVQFLWIFLGESEDPIEIKKTLMDDWGVFRYESKWDEEFADLIISMCKRTTESHVFLSCNDINKLTCGRKYE